MSRPIRVAMMAMVLVLIAVATTLATISGAIGAIDWASQTFGSLVVYLAGAFLAGAAVTHGIHRAIADRRLSAAGRVRDRR